MEEELLDIGSSADPVLPWPDAGQPAEAADASVRTDRIPTEPRSSLTLIPSRNTCQFLHPRLAQRRRLYPETHP